MYKRQVGHPGGFVGKIVVSLLVLMALPGVWYRFWLDNYYNSLELTRYVIETFSFCIGGTMQRRRTTDLVYFGGGKRPMPSLAHPKGSLKVAKKVREDIYVYGWMDSSAVYFIDACLGPGFASQILRRNSQGVPIPFQVPSMIAEYNKFMGGVDVFDQVRKGFGVDTLHATKKWTLRMLEILFSMIMSQSYNVHRYVNRNRRAVLKSPSEFKIDVIKGLLNHLTVRGQDPPPVVAEQHHLRQFDEGSRGGGGKHRHQGDCRHCANSINVGDKRVRKPRRTQYYCTVCKVCFHPECFTTKW